MGFFMEEEATAPLLLLAAALAGDALFFVEPFLVSTAAVALPASH